MTIRAILVMVSVVFVVALVGTVSHASEQHKATSATRTVWEAVYTEAQSKRGETAYMQGCASCHADDLRGNATAPALAGDDFWPQWRGRNVGDLLEQIRTLMPPDRPGGLPGATYRDIVAFILGSNHFPAGDKELDADVSVLRRIMITAKPLK